MNAALFSSTLVDIGFPSAWNGCIVDGMEDGM